MISSLRGSPRRPVLGVSSDHTPTDTDNSLPAGVGEDDTVPSAPKLEEVKVNIPRRDEEAPMKMYLGKSDIERYGKTPGRAGCAALGTASIAAHSQRCRDRISVDMMKGDFGRERLKVEEARRQRKR